MRAPTLLLLAFATAAAGPPAPPAPPADDTLPQPIAVAVPHEAGAEAARRLLVQPYAEATGTALGAPAWDGTEAALRALAAAHTADLVLLDGAMLPGLCQAGVLERMDWTALGRDRFVAGAASDCGAGAYVAATVLAWDRGKLAGTPGWGDFWDVAKHPGRRGLRRGARGNLEIALLADGVAAGDVYRTLRSKDGVDRAFRKLDQLKPYILWWDQPGQPAQLLAGAKVLLTSAPVASLPAAGKAAVGVQWEGSVDEVMAWARLAAAPHGRGAAAALLVASDAARGAAFARATGLGPATRAATALLAADARPRNPGTPANQQGALLLDGGFWAENAEKLEARFAAWAGT